VNLRPSPIFLVILASILAGVLNLFSKNLLLAGMEPIEICACREGVTAIVFFFVLLLIDRSAFKIRWQDIWIFALFGAFNVASNICVFTAQESLPLEVAAVLEMTSPYFVLIFAFFLFRDKITRMKVLAAVLAFLGCIFIIGLTDGEVDFSFMGLVIGLLSGITLAAFTIGGKFVSRRGYSENTAMFYFFLFSAIIIAPFTDFGHIFSLASSDGAILASIIFMGIVCTLLPNYFVIYAVSRVHPATVSIIITSSLIVSTLCGVLAFGDQFDFEDVIGIILIMTAIVILDPPDIVKQKIPWYKE